MISAIRRAALIGVCRVIAGVGPMLSARSCALGQPHLEPLDVQPPRFQRGLEIGQRTLQQAACLGSCGIEAGVNAI